MCSSLASWSVVWCALSTPGFFFPLGVGLALLPAGLVVAFYSRQRERRVMTLRRSVAGARDVATGKTPALARAAALPQRAAPATLMSANDNIESEAAQGLWRAIASVTPLFLLTLMGFAAIQLRYGLCGDQTPCALVFLGSPWMSTATTGFLGAYVYVVTILARRILAHDISNEAVLSLSASALWGAILGAFASRLPFLTEGSDSTLFLAFALGAFPSVAQRYLARAIGRLTGDTQSFPSRRPLEQLSGMTPEIIERLADEQILDALHLADAEPVKLTFRVPYGLTQVVDWMDEAILFRYLGTSFGNREAAGISGALDLAGQWALYAQPSVEKPEGLGAPLVSGTDDRYAGLDELARALGLSVHSLWRVGYSLYYDPQLALVFALSNSGPDGEPG